ncbi:hypothetical protein [Streptomyces melanogenes]|uniref:Integral membrane protein n=1 Tax=Streptomyces melanogenes TaxID=67326 RepID=A0ABZ1XTL8_9ACTN|nr:hypothetical protein [Streptomyces melanogenes]
MSIEQQTPTASAQVTTEAQEWTGTTSMVMGTVAVAFFGCPWLPHAIPPQIRHFPLYLIVPLGIAAIVYGIGDLRHLRGEEGVVRGRARAGVALGLAAVAVPLAFIVWAWVSLSE